jgi:hypothetical protein
VIIFKINSMYFGPLEFDAGAERRGPVIKDVSHSALQHQECAAAGESFATALERECSYRADLATLDKKA